MIVRVSLSFRPNWKFLFERQKAVLNCWGTTNLLRTSFWTRIKAGIRFNTSFTGTEALKTRHPAFAKVIGTPAEEIRSCYCMSNVCYLNTRAISGASTISTTFTWLSSVWVQSTCAVTPFANTNSELNQSCVLQFDRSCRLPSLPVTALLCLLPSSLFSADHVSEHRYVLSPPLFFVHLLHVPQVFITVSAAQFSSTAPVSSYLLIKPVTFMRCVIRHQRADLRKLILPFTTADFTWMILPPPRYLMRIKKQRLLSCSPLRPAPEASDLAGIHGAAHHLSLARQLLSSVY